MSVGLLHLLPSRKGIDAWLVSCSQHVFFEMLTVLQTAFEMLEPDEGKLSRSGSEGRERE